jgi:hypothetical protein
MMKILDTTHFKKCIHTLDRAWHLLQQPNPESIEYEIYRLVCIKEFEIILKQSRELLRKELAHYFEVPSRMFHNRSNQ